LLLHRRPLPFAAARCGAAVRKLLSIASVSIPLPLPTSLSHCAHFPSLSRSLFSPLPLSGGGLFCACHFSLFAERVFGCPPVRAFVRVDWSPRSSF
jgi:hypothetical protein